MHLASLTLLHQRHVSFHSRRSNMSRFANKEGARGAAGGDEEDLSPFQKVSQWFEAIRDSDYDACYLVESITLL